MPLRRYTRIWRCVILDNFQYYSTVYGGTLDEKSFEQLSTAAAAVLTILLYPVAPDMLTGERITAYQEALCRQVEYQAAKNTAASDVKSETLGDYSIVYRDAADVRVCGNPLSPDAASILSAAGLICRWV